MFAENKARQPGGEPGEYLGDWGPSSRQWSARALASELLPRTLRGMFWMEMGDFLRVFNTLYAVDLAGGAIELSLEEEKKKARRRWLQRQQQQQQASKTSSSDTSSPASRPSTGAAFELAVGAGSREGRCLGLWEGEGCGGRYFSMRRKICEINDHHVAVWCLKARTGLSAKNGKGHHVV